MKKLKLRSILAVFLLISFSVNAQSLDKPLAAKIDAGIEPYVDFLRKEKTSAKDYILSLFKDKDIVVLCERDHRELTQYNLILDVIRDPYFIDNVGVVYTEVGDKNLNPLLNDFLLSNQQHEAEIKNQILHFQRNSMSPLWDKTCFAYFLKGLFQINETLKPEKKIRMYPLDLMGVLDDPSSENIIMQYRQQAFRDSLMANEFIKQYDEQMGTWGKSKALIIMNSRHAFKCDVVGEDDRNLSNMARIVYEKYSGKVASILINNWSMGRGEDFFGLMQDGKWDAAFQYLSIENLGFDMNHTPFGNDSLDYGKWILMHNHLKFQDAFDGFVFYQPIGRFEMGIGIDGLMDDGFYDEYIERVKRLNAAFKRDVYPIGTQEQIMKLNKQTIIPMNNLEMLQRKIDKWLD